MPHSTPQVDWELAHRVTQRLAASAPECIFSFARQIVDGVGKPSPILPSVLGPYLVTSAEAFLSNLGASPGPAQTSLLIDGVDNSFIPWPTAESAGGSEILKMQAACPFQAFASRRLGARDLAEPEPGLSDLDRGNILHKVLENLWSPSDTSQWQLHSRDDLFNARAQGRLKGIIEHHVTGALVARQDPGNPWMTAFLASEHRRLCTLLTQWLEKELERKPFKVEACEQKLETRVGDLKLQLRIDRIDSLPSDGRLLLDYKSGKVTKSAWEEERPEEPQLPLYAAFGNVENLQGVLFAQIRAHDMDFIGRVVDPKHSFYAKPDQGRKAEEYNEETAVAWREVLLGLAEDFLRGNASVTPKKYPTTCEYCALPSLCRVAESPVPVEAMEVDDPEVDYAAGAGSE